MADDQSFDPLVTRQDQAGVTTLTLNRPRSINALSEAMLCALQSELDAIAQDRAVRVVILRGAGDHFCAGHNLKEMTAAREATDGGSQYFLDLFATCSRMMQTLIELPQPVIAEVSGIATAAGCQLVASCDLAVASRGGALCHVGCQYRPVLFHAHGGPIAQCGGQTCDGNAAPRRFCSRGAGGRDGSDKPCGAP